MKCPNCRCEIDILSTICPYCGLVFNEKTERRIGKDVNLFYQNQRNTYTQDCQTYTGNAMHTDNRRSAQPMRKNSRKKQYDKIQINQETIIWLLIILILISLIQLFVMIFL